MNKEDMLVLLRHKVRELVKDNTLHDLQTFIKEAIGELSKEGNKYYNDYNNWKRLQKIIEEMEWYD